MHATRAAPTETPRVTFLLSTHNRRTAVLDTLSQLQSLQGSGNFSAQTIVIDNASTDGAADAIAAQFPSVNLIRQRKNRGACGKNLGLAQATGHYIVFLDDDSYPDADSIGRMIEYFQADPQLGAAVFNVVLPDGSHESSALPSVFIGCGTGFGAKALIQAGGLPEDFFMQAEEYDLSLRLLDAGWKIKRFAGLHVDHLKTPIARSPSRTTRLDVRNNLLVIARRFPGQWRWPYAMDWMRRYRWIAQTNGWRHRLAFWRGLGQGVIASIHLGRRQPANDDAFEDFAMIREIHHRLADAGGSTDFVRSFSSMWARTFIRSGWPLHDLDLEVVAIADANLNRRGREYRGIPILEDAAARALRFDAAVITNISPVHGPTRAQQWRSIDSRPVLELFESPRAAALSVAA